MLAMNDLWTLPQALAWCIWRNEEAVKNTVEVGIDCMGLLNAAIREADGDQSKGENAFSIRNAFHEALFGGKLKAVGVHQGELTAREIHAAEWRDIDEFRVFFQAKRPDDVGAVNRNGDQEVIFNRVTVNSRDVQKLWPPIAAVIKPGKVAAGAAVRQFLEKEISDRGGFISQEQACKITRKIFPDVSRDDIRKLCKELTGNDKRGRRNKPK